MKKPCGCFARNRSDGSESGDDLNGQRVFQVRAQRRGDIARAHFYFAIRYSPPIEDVVLRQWHLQAPPDARERERNDRVQVFQQNRNPFVDYPNLTERLSNF